MSQLSDSMSDRASDIVFQMLDEPGDLRATLRHIVRSARTMFSASICTIHAFHPITGRSIAAFTITDNQMKENTINGERVQNEERRKRDDIALQVLKQGELFIEDLTKFPAYKSDFTSKHHIQSFAAFALCARHQRKPLGLLYINFKGRRAFREEECERLRTFVAQASFVLQATLRLKHHQTIADIGHDISLELDNIDVLFEKLCTRVADVLEVSHLALAIYDWPQKMLDLHEYSHEHCTHQKRPLEGIYKQVIESGKPIVRLGDQRLAAGQVDEGSLMCQPLKFRDLILGVLSVRHILPNAYSKGDLSVFQALANYIALAVHDIHLYSDLKQMNETGRLLAQQLDSERVLQLTVEQILEAAKADLVLLYPYESDEQQFRVLPRIAGQLIDQTVVSAMFPRCSDNIAALLLERQSPIFAKKSAQLYQELLMQSETRLTPLALRAHLTERKELSGYPEDVSERFAGREQIRSIAALPLRVMDEVVGALFINFRQAQRFESPQKVLLEGMAHFAAIAIKNAQVVGKMNRRHEREGEIIRTIERELSHVQDLQGTLGVILRLANELVRAENASVLLYDPQTKILQSEICIGEASEHHETLKISLQRHSHPSGITRWVLEQKQPACVRDVHHEYPWCDLFLPNFPDTISELDVPLIDNEEVIGVFNFESTREGAFLLEDQNFLQTLADQVINAVKNAQVHERAKRLTDEGQTLNAISKEIANQPDPLHVFEQIVQKALLLTGSANGVLMLYDPATETLFAVAESGLAHAKRWRVMGLNQGLVGYAARTKEVVNVDSTHPLWSEHYVEFVAGTNSDLIVPILANGNVLRGVITMESPIPKKYSARDEHLLKSLADLAVLALQNNELYEKAEKDAARFSHLYRAGKELSNISEWEHLEHAYDAIVSCAREHCKSLVVLRLLDEETQELVVKRVTQGRDHDVLPRVGLTGHVSGVALRERRTIRIDDTRAPSSEVPVSLPEHSPLRSLVVTPVQFNYRDYGTLILASEAVGAFRDADTFFFEALAQQLASTIYRIEAVQERQMFEQRAHAAEVMSTIGQSAYELTHRLGNGLGLVDSYADTIRNELSLQNATSPIISRKLDNIVQSVSTVLQLSNNLKNDLMNLQNHDEVDEPFVSVAPQSLFEEVQEQLLLPPSITLVVQVDHEVASVFVIRRLVLDVLYNLISNAVDVLSKGGQIMLCARNEGRSVALEVADTGPGISESQKSRIFELFFSSKGSSGFGLWSARRNALRNRGVLEVTSEPGCGATFTLLLPRAENKNEYCSDISP